MAKSKKETTQKPNSGMEIPDYAIESLARSLLPVMQAYYESEEGQKALEEWKENHPDNRGDT